MVGRPDPLEASCPPGRSGRSPPKLPLPSSVRPPPQARASPSANPTGRAAAPASPPGARIPRSGADPGSSSSLPGLHLEAGWVWGLAASWALWLTAEKRPIPSSHAAPSPGGFVHTDTIMQCNHTTSAQQRRIPGGGRGHGQARTHARRQYRYGGRGKDGRPCCGSSGGRRGLVRVCHDAGDDEDSDSECVYPSTHTTPPPPVCCSVGSATHHMDGGWLGGASTSVGQANERRSVLICICEL